MPATTSALLVRTVSPVGVCGGGGLGQLGFFYFFFFIGANKVYSRSGNIVIQLTSFTKIKFITNAHKRT